MNRREHLLVILMEECSEVIQDTAKALRFGLDEGRDIDCTNAERLKKEFNQLRAVADMLDEEGVDMTCDYEVMDQKRNKVEEYLEYSKECGTLECGTFDDIPGIQDVEESELEEYFETMRQLIAKRDKRKRHENDV